MPCQAQVPAAFVAHLLLLTGCLPSRLAFACSQVDLLLDVLQEMRPLAAFTGEEQPQHGQQQARQMLLALLDQLLAPGIDAEQGGQQQALDTPGSRQAFLQLVAGLCGVGHTQTTRAAAAASGAAAGAASRGEPLLSPAAVLQHVVAPALERQRGVVAAGEAGADLLLLPLQVAEALLDAATRQQEQQLLDPLLRGLLDLDSRRVDSSPAALLASLDTFELAASLLQRTSSSAGGGAGSDAGAYFQQQLLGPAAAEPQQPVQQLRRRMVRLLAALLPCCTAEEAREILHVVLPTAIQAVLLRQPALAAAGPAAPAGILAGAHAAAVEAACRAAKTLAHPEQAPIAGEQTGVEEASAAATAQPSALRQVAVERVLQHLTQHCVRLASGAHAAAVAAAGEARALGLRCFRELCQLAAVVQPAGFDTATLQAGLLRLAQQLLPCQPVSGVAAGAAATTVEGQLQAEEVERQLSSAAGTLPAGRLRDLVRLGIQQQVQQQEAHAA
jgi:hypothetical protein